MSCSCDGFYVAVAFLYMEPLLLGASWLYCFWDPLSEDVSERGLLIDIGMYIFKDGWWLF